MKQNQSEKGIAHLGLILGALFVFIAIALGGWYVWQQNNNKSTPTDNTQTSSSSNTETKENVAEDKTFDCKGIFSVSYPESLRTGITSAEQCLISNVSEEEMPPVGPLPPDQLGLFFSTETTHIATSEDYLAGFIERSQEDYPLELKSQQKINLDNGDTAVLATLYGGHPTEHEFHFFVYIKNGTAITTSYPTNSNHKETALDILKSVQ